MPGSPDLTSWRHDDDFRSDDTAVVVLDPDLVIRAVNPAYELTTGFSADRVMSRFVFEAFPGDPGRPDGTDGLSTMTASFERVLREGRPHDLVAQRYDIPDPGRPDRFRHRVWAPVTVPVRRNDVVVGLACRFRDLRMSPEGWEAVRPFRDALRHAVASEDAQEQLLGEAAVWCLRELAEKAGEVSQLRQALTSRATIDQAKGLLMAQHRCGPDEAFRLLVRLSNDSNVRLADVAAALVYQVQHETRPG